MRKEDHERIVKETREYARAHAIVLIVSDLIYAGACLSHGNWSVYRDPDDQGRFLTAEGRYVLEHTFAFKAARCFLEGVGEHNTRQAIIKLYKKGRPDDRE